MRHLACIRSCSGKLGRLFGAFFFFSSRRRHTRCSRDWSSDVCSSDLLIDSGFAGMRPWTRNECVRLLGEAGDRVESGVGGTEAEKIYNLLEAEFRSDRERIDSGGLLRAQIESRSEEHTSELQSRLHLVCRLLLEKKKTLVQDVIDVRSHQPSLSSASFVAADPLRALKFNALCASIITTLAVRHYMTTQRINQPVR